MSPRVEAGEARVRENVMHEIGLFQGRYGRNRVILLHEEGVNIPTNLSGVVYSPFPKGNIAACFHLLQRELKMMSVSEYSSQLWTVSDYTSTGIHPCITLGVTLIHVLEQR